MQVRKCRYCGVDIAADYENCPFCGERVVSPEPVGETGANNNETGGVPVGEPQRDGPDGYKDPEQLSFEELTDAETGQSERREDKNDAGNRAGTVKDEGPTVCHVESAAGTILNQPLTNGLKVFLTALTVLMPGVGPIIGIICAVVFMNSEVDADRRSFGQALLITALAIFALACISCFGIAMVLTALKEAPGRWMS